MLNFAEEEKSPAIIKVVGVGGAGMNAIERMSHLHLQGVELIAMNTDEQVLRRSSAHQKVHLGTKLTRGMGAGAKPEIGAQAAMEDREKIMNVLKGADMVFITAGMGGGTGTGAAPIVADVAKELKALTVGVITLPFKAEGQKKLEIARAGQANLREKVDTLITIPNDAIFKIIDSSTPVKTAFKYIDDILARAVMGISDIINSTGMVNVDFADVKTIMSNNGDAVIGLGEGSGENRVHEALQNAIHHPLLDGRSIDGASGVLINVVASENLSMYEYHEIQERIHEMVNPDATIIVGFTEDPSKGDTLSVTVIATGFRKTTTAKVTSPQEKQEKLEEVEKPMHVNPIRRNGSDNISYLPGLQQGLKFPNIDTNIESLDIPTFLRRKNK